MSFLNIGIEIFIYFMKTMRVSSRRLLCPTHFNFRRDDIDYKYTQKANHYERILSYISHSSYFL